MARTCFLERCDVRNSTRIFCLLGGPWVFAMGLAGCGGGDFPTAKVSGVVLCKGKPVADAMVYFEPLKGSDSDNPLVGKQGFSFSDKEGRFTLTTYEPNDGAVVGKHRVRVGGPDARCECSLNEERDLMQVEVKAGEDNEFKLELPPATVADRRRTAQMRDEDD